MAADESAGFGARQSSAVGLRVGDAERQAAATLLQDHFSQGRLTWTELDERLGVAYSARTRGELDTLFHDLPAAPPAVTLAKAEPTADFWRRLNQRQMIFAACFVAIVVAAIIAVGSPGPGFILIPLFFFVHSRRNLARGGHPRSHSGQRPRLGNPYAPGGDRHHEVQHLRHRHAPALRSDD